MVLEKFDLKNTLVVITGAAGLLGKRHAEAVLEAGGRVALLDKNKSGLEDFKGILAEYPTDKWLTCETDITKRKSIEDSLELIKKHFKDTPQVLINNAAIDPKADKNMSHKNMSRLENFAVEQWDVEIAVGLTGSMLCSQIFGSEMAKNNKGVILNVASDLGLIAPDQRLYKKAGVPENEQNVKPVTYSVIKHGLIGLTKYIATYWANQGVRCNAMAPGGVYNSHPDEFVQKISNLIPMGRMADKDEYKAAVVFLISDASSYMNGATLVLDGGRSVW